VPRPATTRRAAEIIALLECFSAPYGTTIVSRRWYGGRRVRNSGFAVGALGGSTMPLRA
jgi:hypothetical protein